MFDLEKELPNYVSEAVDAVEFKLGKSKRQS